MKKDEIQGDLYHKTEETARTLAFHDSDILPSFTLSFHDGGKDLGRFYYDPEEKTLKFEGEADEAAKIFVDFVIEKFKEWIKYYGGRE